MYLKRVSHHEQVILGLIDSIHGFIENKCLSLYEKDVKGEKVIEIMDVSSNMNLQDLTENYRNHPENIQDHNYSVLSKKETTENEFKECNVCKCKFPSETISNHLKSCAFNSLQKAKQALKLSATEKLPHIESFLHEELGEGNK